MQVFRLTNAQEGLDKIRKVRMKSFATIFFAIFLLFVFFVLYVTIRGMAWIIAGLGNPGNEYDNTRHNTGRMAVEHFVKLVDFSDWKEEKKARSHVARGLFGKNIGVALLPNTFMNKSGTAVATFVKSAKAAERLIVVYDDMDLPLGKIKLSFDRGSGGHKGIESIARAVKTKNFTRIRVGVSPESASGEVKKPHGEKEVLKFILGTFKPAEMKELDVVFDRVAEAIEAIVIRGPLVAMNEFNRN